MTDKFNPYRYFNEIINGDGPNEFDDPSVFDNSKVISYGFWSAKIWCRYLFLPWSDGLPPLTELLQIDENLVSSEDTEHSKSVCLALCNVHARASDIMGASESAANEGNCGIAVSSSDGDCSATWRKDQILDLTGCWCLNVS